MWRIEHRKGYNNCSVSNPSRFIIALLLPLLLSACNQADLYSELTERQANEVQAELMAHGLRSSKSPSKQEEMWAIRVENDQFPQAMAILKAAGLPRAEAHTMGDIFPKEGFVSSPLEERARYLYALSQELSETLSQIDGVVSARVHVALPEKKSLSKEDGDASVSVVIIHRPDVDLTPHETDIKAIVTDGIEGLDDINRVTVKFFARHQEVLPQPPQATILEGSWAAGGYWFYSFVFMCLVSLSVFALYWWTKRNEQENRQQQDQ